MVSFINPDGANVITTSSMMHTIKSNWLRICILIFLPILMLANAPIASAQSADQKAVYDSGVGYFDVTYEDFCSTAASGVSGNGTITTDIKSFVDAYGQAAFDVGKKGGIPYDAILAHASVESNNGQSQLNKQANNFFGIKAESSWTGPTVTMPTHEEVNGVLVAVNAQFEVYASPEAGFQAYVDFLRRNPRYANVFNYQHDPIGYFQALKTAGYMTSSTAVANETSRLSAIQAYIASKNLFPPSSQVTYDVQPGSPTPAASTASASSPCVGSSGNASGVVAIALQEIGNHYSKYTNGRTENWCADFVSWVYKTAGKAFTPTPGVPMLDGWQIPSVDGMKTYLETKGQFFPKSASAPAPQPGDIVIYKNGMSHTNIVAEANGYMVKTVGGNQESNSLTQSVVSESKGFIDIRNDSTVTGWGRLP
jgi:hypothetical protein